MDVKKLLLFFIAPKHRLSVTTLKILYIFIVCFLFSATYPRENSPDSSVNLYHEIFSIIARNADRESIGNVDFSSIALKHAPHAAHGLKWIEKKGDYSVFSSRIELLLKDLKLSSARYYTKDDKEYGPLCTMLKYLPVSKEIKKQLNDDSSEKITYADEIHQHAHMLSDGSILVLLPSTPAIPENQKSEKQADKLVVHFFGSSTCGECHSIRTEILKPLAEKYVDKLEVKVHDIDSDEGLKILDALEKAYHVKESYPIQLYLPDTVLIGGEDVQSYSKSLIEEYISQPAKWKYRHIAASPSTSTEILRERFSRFTFLGVLAAGLIDGINPCAIATMIFLISFLATQKRKRSEVLAIGISFTAAVFVTYLLLGLGAFKILTMLESYVWVSKTIKWLAVAVAGGLGVVSFYDAIAFGISRKTGSIKLQLPKAIKMRIHKVVSTNLTGTQLITGAIITGFLVTLLEAVCTGQVYLPTIVLMTKKSGLRLSGWLYLIFYNFLFVLPLLIVMILAYFGMTWKTLSNATQRHLPVLKVLLGIVLVGLAVFLGISV